MLSAVLKYAHYFKWKTQYVFAQSAMNYHDEYLTLWNKMNDIPRRQIPWSGIISIIAPLLCDFNSCNIFHNEMLFLLAESPTKLFDIVISILLDPVIFCSFSDVADLVGSLLLLCTVYFTLGAFAVSS